MKRRQYTPSLKAKVALEAIKGDKTMAELSQKYQIHQNLISNWKKQLLEAAADIFGNSAKHKNDQEKDIKELHAKIGRLTMENDFLSRVLDR